MKSSVFFTNMSSWRLNTFLHQPSQRVTFCNFLYIERWKCVTTEGNLLIWPYFGLSACLLIEGFVDKKCFENRAFTIRLESIPLHFTYLQKCWLSDSFLPCAGWRMLKKATNLSLLAGTSLQSRSLLPAHPFPSQESGSTQCQAKFPVQCQGCLK